MRALHAFRGFLVVLAIAFAAAAIASLLPNNSYQRWQLVDGTIQNKARWIYERSHFDARPIDVAIVGPSRTARLDAKHLQADLAQLGTPANVVNFAMPEGGRNTNDAVVEEMLSAKTPKLIIIGVIEKPSRFGHPAFKYLAPARLVAVPGYPLNLNYLSDLIYLPFRQMKLFIADLWPAAGALTKTFDPRAYQPDLAGPMLFPLANGITRAADEAAPIDELQAGVQKLESGVRPPFLPASLADWEFGDDRYYIRRIVAAAQKKHVKVAFLFLPYFTGPSDILEEPFYRRYGPVWNAGFVAYQAPLYNDYAHLTTSGADRVSDWMAPKISQMLREGASPP